MEGFFKKESMSSFVRKVSFSIVSLFLLNILFFSFHFASVKHYWNRHLHRFEHVHHDNYEHILLLNNSIYSLRENHNDENFNKCAVIKFIFSYFPLVSIISFSIFSSVLLTLFFNIFKKISFITSILYFAPKNSPPSCFA